MTGSAVAKRYGRALFELATERNEVESTGRALEALARAFEESAELRRVFENPQYLPEVRKAVAIALAERVQAPETVARALIVLGDRRRIRHLRAISDVYQRWAEAVAGRLRAEVISAVPLSEAYERQLRNILEEASGRSVTLVCRVDPTLIGGVVTRIGDVVFDGSLRNRLVEMRHHMLAASSTGGRA